jgi:integrin alpha 8
VGAPYDDDGNGLVYIFHGSADGIQTTPTQIIKGSSYNLKAFGHALSGGLDLDGNKYPDLIVGAYKSDAVVLFRSKAVIRTSLSGLTVPRVIDFDSRDYFCDKNKTRMCVEFEYCIDYGGKAVPALIKMHVTVELDTEKYQNKSLIRAFFLDTKSNVFAFNYTFKHETKRCFKQNIFIKRSTRDKLTPIKCRVNLTLPSYDTEWELMPMFNSIEDSSRIHEIRFLRNCGPDDICVPNLQVSASTPSKKFVYGSQGYIDLNIKIENAKEDAFEAQCHTTLPQGVNYVKAFMSANGGASMQQASLPCYQNKAPNETKIICDLGNPMIGGTVKSFTIRVAPQSIPLNQEIIKFNITASSSNKEDKRTMFDNENFVYVVLDAMPSIALIGKQYQEQVIYENKLMDQKPTDELVTEDEIGPEIMHEYKLMNKGPSQVLMSELLIAWQRQIKTSVFNFNGNNKNKDFLYLMEMPYTEGPIKCGFGSLSINPMNLTVCFLENIIFCF